MSSVTLQQAAIIVDAALKKGRETNCDPLTVAVLGTGETHVRFGAHYGLKSDIAPSPSR
jgi:hypothetical protein